MKSYIVHSLILCGIDIIAHKGDIIELDEKEPETITLEAQKHISQVEKPIHKIITKNKK
ncbi:MAG: hypothetical protein ACOYN4_04795 [Bacteroidales bacterium]